MAGFAEGRAPPRSWKRKWLLPLAGVSNLLPTGHTQPRMATNATQRKIINLLKTFFFPHPFSLVFAYLTCGPRQRFLFQCGPETPEGWTGLLAPPEKSATGAHWSEAPEAGARPLTRSSVRQHICVVLSHKLCGNFLQRIGKLVHLLFFFFFFF